MPQRKQPLDIDREVYKWRHLIENFFCKLKEFKRIAMRSDKTDTSFAATYQGGPPGNSLLPLHLAAQVPDLHIQPVAEYNSLRERLPGIRDGNVGDRNRI
jgi:hypothetical protein